MQEHVFDALLEGAVRELAGEAGAVGVEVDEEVGEGQFVDCGVAGEGAGGPKKTSAWARGLGKWGDALG